MKFILSALILWISWFLAVVNYGEKDVIRYLQTIPEIILLVSSAYLARTISNRWRYLAKGILFISFIVYFIQCIYYSQVGELITILALENADQAYLLMSLEYILALLFIIIISLWFVFGKITISRRKKLVSFFCILLSVIFVVYQNTNKQFHRPFLKYITQNIQWGGDACILIL